MEKPTLTFGFSMGCTINQNPELQHQQQTATTMKLDIRSLTLFNISLLFLTLLVSHSTAAEMKVIAHRGASGHLLENSFPAFGLAAAVKSNFISMDIVMTQDNYLVLFRDIHITKRTNVADIYPERQRVDGRYYIIDFTLQELRSLRLTPQKKGDPTDLTIPTFAGALSLIRQLERALGSKIGIAPEIKKPWFHMSEDKDIGKATLDMLHLFKYNTTETPVYLQCYDPDELQRISKMPIMSQTNNFKLVQLIDNSEERQTERLERGKWVPYNYDWMFTQMGTKLLARYADAIGFDKLTLLKNANDPAFTNFISNLKLANVKLLALFVNSAAKDLPVHYQDYPSLISHLNEKMNIDILVTDSPALTLELLHKKEPTPGSIIPDLKQPLFSPPPIQ